MKTLLIIAISFFSVSNTALAQMEELEKDAQTYSEALVAFDIEKLMQYTYEHLIDVSGGPEYIAEEYIQDKEYRKSVNTEFLEVKILINDANVVYNREMQNIVTQEFVANFGGDKFHIYNNLLAISKDNGKSWKFVDLAKHDSESIKDFVPNFSPDLSFPTVREAVLIKE